MPGAASDLEHAGSGREMRRLDILENRRLALLIDDPLQVVPTINSVPV